MLALSFSGFDPTVWTGRAVQAGCEQMEGVVLRICIRPLHGAFVAPGHYGYPRAPDLILGKALRGRLGHQDHGYDGETVSPFPQSNSQTSAGIFSSC